MFASVLLCYAYALRPLLRVARPYPRASSAFSLLLRCRFASLSFSPCLPLPFSPSALILSPAPSFAFRPHLASRFLSRPVLVFVASHLCAPLRPLLQTADRSEGKKLSIGDSLKQLIRRIIRELSPERGFNPNNAPFAVEIQPHTLEARLFFPGSTRAVVTNRDFFAQNACRTLQVSCMRRFLYEVHRARSAPHKKRIAYDVHHA